MNATKIAPQLLRIPEAAGRLGCSERHVYRLISQRALSVVDIATPGSRCSKSRIREDELARYIDAQTAN
jgi:excisionase family DNA binding protein